MDETLFYILGIALVLTALALSTVGLRWEGFPPGRGLLVGITVGIVAMVAATATFAWINAEDEQSEHAAELAEERAAAAEETAGVVETESEGDSGPAQEASSEETDAVESPPTQTSTAAADGATVFESAGCSGCHTLAAAGSTAQTGPNLDGTLKGKPAAYIETAIVDPNDNIAPSYPPDVMPQDYEEQLTPEELTALVAYLVESTGGKR